jgi:hypothetical protein
MRSTSISPAALFGLPYRNRRAGSSVGWRDARAKPRCCQQLHREARSAAAKFEEQHRTPLHDGFAQHS